MIEYHYLRYMSKSKTKINQIPRYFSKYIPILAIILTVWVISLIPFKVISYGYLPIDDALRHAAKAISGKDWNQILVLRDDIKMDSHVGWHIILTAIHKITGWDALGLVTFSVIALFILFNLSGILLLRRPEAWPIALITILVADPWFLFRIFLGRSYIVTMSVVLVLCFIWPRLKNNKTAYGTAAILALLIALSTWIHCGWYLFILPVVCFFLAREWRAGIMAAGATLTGVAAGAVLTGHPLLFLKQTLLHLLLAYSNHTPHRLLVIEFQPAWGFFPIVSFVILILMWRAIRGTWNRKIIDNPVFILAISVWALGFFTRRISFDLGLPAISCWMAQEFQDFLESRMNYLSWKRITMTIASLGVLYLAITNDIDSRWSSSQPHGYLSLENSSYAAWLPEAGGILYSDDMLIFYSTFYKNPYAPWRYILGFEPALMPKEDLDIYRNIQINNFARSSYAPWVKKMKPQDRLIIHNFPNQAPEIPGLEWHNVPEDIWIGRLPKKHEDNR